MEEKFDTRNLVSIAKSEKQGAALPPVLTQKYTMINQLNRYQAGLKMSHLYPKTDNGSCVCGCGIKLKGRQAKWCSVQCSELAYIRFAILKGDVGVIREELFKIEKGYCRSCGVFDKNWEADHIFPVFMGGGYCGLENFQTLCKDCHQEKSKIQIKSHHSPVLISE